MEEWCLWTVVLEKTPESPLACKEIQPVHPKGNQSWIFIGRTDAVAEIPTLWPPDEKNWLSGKDPDAGKDWRQEKRATEDEMIGWHHQLSGHEFEQAPGIGDGQESLACCSPWGCKESNTTKQLNWTELRFVVTFLWKSKRLSISWLQALSAVISEPKKIKSVTASTFSPSSCHEVMGPGALILDFRMF